jgi:glucokinase
VEEAGAALGVGLISFMHVLNPDVFVIGGGFGTAAFDLLAPAARRELEGGSFEASREGLTIVPARLGVDAGAVGAARSVLSE